MKFAQKPCGYPLDDPSPPGACF